MSFINPCLFFLMFSTLVVSCAPPEPEKQGPPQKVEYPEYEAPPPAVYKDPPAPRRTPEVALPPPEVVIGPDEPGVLSSYKCYEGSLTRYMTLTKIIKRHRAGWFGRSYVTYLYDCHGTNGCQKQFMLRKATHGQGLQEMECLEHVDDQEIFSLCKTAGKNTSTIYGELSEFTIMSNRVSTTIYCQSSLPL